MSKRLILYFLIITSALYGIRYFCYKSLSGQTKGYYGKLSTCFLKQNNYNLLVLGSSRAEMHYNTAVFDSITGSNSFNLGLPGALPELAFGALKAYLAKSVAPKHMIYELDYFSMQTKPEHIIDFNNYFPFFKNKTLLRQFSKVDKRLPNFYYNPYYSLPFFGLKNLSTVLHSRLNVPDETDGSYNKGFYLENFKGHLEYEPVKPVRSFIHPDNRAYLDSIILLCHQNQIELTMVTSPMFAGGVLDVSNAGELKQQVKNLVIVHQLRFFDFSADEISFNRLNFLDHRHMKQSGAKQFSCKLAQFLCNKTRPFTLKQYNISKN